MNQTSLIGRLTADPETHAGENHEMAVFRLAVQRRSDDAGAMFIDVKTFDGLAKTVGDYLTKGRKVAVAGRIEQDEWTTKDGDKRSKHVIIADQVEFLDAPKAADNDAEPEPAAAEDTQGRRQYSRAR